MRGPTVRSGCRSVRHRAKPRLRSLMTAVTAPVSCSRCGAAPYFANTNWTTSTRRDIAHGHHTHDGSRINRVGRLSAALVLTFVYMIAEAVGGWFTNSLALMADAGHMLTDVAALSLTLSAIWFAGRPAT